MTDATEYILLQIDRNFLKLKVFFIEQIFSSTEFVEVECA